MVNQERAFSQNGNQNRHFYKYFRKIALFTQELHFFYDVGL